MRWFVLIVATLVAALALQAGLLAFAMYVLLGVLFLSRFLARQWIENLEATREIGNLEPVEAGSEVKIKVRLRNVGYWPVAWVLIEDLLPKAALRQKPPRLRLKGKRLKLAMIGPGKSVTLKYTLLCDMRGYHQIGPALLETGDLFGLHRRHRLVTRSVFLLVLPKVVPLPRYDFASQRPIGEISLGHRLFEDPTRNAGVRPYQVGDPLQRVHWRATARTGELMCRLFEPTMLAGATILLDLHEDGYPTRGEPYRSELAATIAASLALAVASLQQQIGLASNGRDAIDRVREQTGFLASGYATRDAARAFGEMHDADNRLQPVVIETRRGIEQLRRIREALGRLELSDGLRFEQMVVEIMPRLPRDATVLAVLPRATVATAVVLGELKRHGFAISVILVGLEDDEYARAAGRLLAERIRDVRRVNREADLALLGEAVILEGPNPYGVVTELV